MKGYGKSFWRENLIFVSFKFLLKEGGLFEEKGSVLFLI
jgi:hypothetical protein